MDLATPGDEDSHLLAVHQERGPFSCRESPGKGKTTERGEKATEELRVNSRQGDIPLLEGGKRKREREGLLRWIY